MAIDRDALLKQADKLLRQGKLDGAIAEYVRLVEDQPQDWNSINALGDLYVRAGRNDKAIEQYIRVADHQFSEGFFQKSAALYKKALKLEADHEHILMQLAGIGERQGKFVDAKQYLKQVARQRESRGEDRAAAECILRLGSMPESDVESRIAAAHAAQQLGDGFRAVELLKEAAFTLEKQKKRTEALQLLAEAADIDPFDAELRVRLAREFLAAGQTRQARVYLSFETAGDDIELLLALATLEFAEGKEEDARVAMARVLALAPDREPDIVKLADELMAKGRVESAFACVDAITDAALLQGDAPKAAAALRTFIDHTPHQPATAKLVQVAEDLLRRDPANEAHAELLRHILTLRGISNPETAIARVRAGESAEEPPPDALSMDDFDLTAAIPEVRDAGALPEVDIFVYPENDIPTMPEVPVADLLIEPPAAQEAIPDLPITSDEDDRVMLELAEIDLSSALSGLLSSSPQPPVSFVRASAGEAASAMASASEPPAETPASHVEEAPATVEEPAPDLEDVFAQMRAKSAREQQASAALAQYDQATQLIEQGLDKEAIAALEAASRVPMMRFRAATRLGRLLIDRGDLNDGVEWLERAAEAPPTSPEEGYDLLYELAGALEAQGESARALAILMELDAESDGYRDVRTRIVYLSRAQQAESDRP
ncbi:MAG TPA: tetratricopeptide repeat protein [Vicinamibacterales bacterium]|nr:tetratricopeptide repeat protein [Vicinamibacterales bacterium]